MNSKFLRAALFFFLSLSTSFLGCKDDQRVRCYQAPKEALATMTMDSGPADSSAASEVGFPGSLRWTLPAGWKQVPPPPGRMGIRSAAAIQISPDHPQILLTMSALPPAAATLAPNVTRWAGIIGLQYSDAMLGQAMHTQSGDLSTDIVDLNNDAAPPQRLFGAIVQKPGEAWAFKVSGPGDAVGSQKSRFNDFIASIRFDDSGSATAAAISPAPVPGPALPPGHPQVAPGRAAVGVPESAAPVAATQGVAGARWTLPVGWTAEAVPNSFRLATIYPGTKAALIKVSKMRGLGGGLGMNVSRWREEVGLGPVDDSTADPGQQIQLGECRFTLHDYTGPANGGSRLIVAAVDVEGETWYFKLSGPADTITAQNVAFNQFLASLKIIGYRPGTVSGGVH